MTTPTPQRIPRIFDHDRAQDILKHVNWPKNDTKSAIKAIASSSSYLFALFVKEHQWLETALDSPDRAIEQILTDLETTAPDQVQNTLREAKRRVALLTAYCDLTGIWPLHKVTATLTIFADKACDVALRACLLQEIYRRKLPQLTPDDITDRSGYSIFAMGKMGAYELNYSSDIDLICLFDETRFEPGDFFDVRSSFVRATRRMVSVLSDNTAEGYVFRTDLRLRPDPAVTPVCMAMEAAERYYESVGRTWERAAWIKARPCAGDLDAGQTFQTQLKPFVWRRHLDYAAIEDAHNMRLAIREHKNLGGRLSLPGHNMKLGRGGIREIEFFTQTRQLISGGRDSSLRASGTLDGLRALAAKGWVPQDVTDTLTECYIYHRTIEHRLQMVQDAQTHSLPTSEEGFERLAAMMDCSLAELKGELTEKLQTVDAIAERFFAPTGPRTSTPKREPNAKSADRWLSYPALRSPRARDIFSTIQPVIVEKLAKADRPDEAYDAFDRFLSGLPAGVQLFSLFEANPQLVDLLVDIASVSTELAAYLSRNAGVFDAVIAGHFFGTWPGRDALAQELDGLLTEETDYEGCLDCARRWGKEWHFRIGVHVLRGMISPDEAGRSYADLAEATLTALMPRVIAQFSVKHGPPPGRGAVVLGMGSLGAGALHSQSDLDLIVIYDAADVEMSNGRKPLASKTYYARLTQALVTSMTARTAEGRLYEVDMRLRPSGNQGPVATSLTAFETYQKEQAWTWEHLALTRARVICGPENLARDAESVRQAVLTAPRDRQEILRDLSQMRARIHAAKGSGSELDAKIGAGRMQDIELFAQGVNLLAGRGDRATLPGLSRAHDLGLISDADSQALADSHTLFWSLQIAVKLLQGEKDTLEDLGAGAMSFLAKQTGFDDMTALNDAIETDSRRAAAIIDASLPLPEEAHS